MQGYNPFEALSKLKECNQRSAVHQCMRIGQTLACSGRERGGLRRKSECSCGPRAPGRQGFCGFAGICRCFVTFYRHEQAA